MIPAPSPGGINKHKPTPKKPQQKKQQQQPGHHSVEKTAKSIRHPVDYEVLLLSLADEYLNAAHRHGTAVTLATSQVDVEQYYKLVATGLGCLEAVLKVCLASKLMDCSLSLVN